MSGDIWRPYIQPLKVQLICLSVIVISTSKRGHTRSESLFLRDGNSTQRIDLAELLYIEAQSNCASFVFENGKPVMSLVSLRKLEDLLPSHFVRVHRSYIVNERRIRKIEGNQLQVVSAKVPIGQSYRESLYQRLNIVN